jgi:hypothetical protein
MNRGIVVVGNIIGHYSSAYLHSNDNALHVKDLFADFAKPHIKYKTMSLCNAKT